MATATEVYKSLMNHGVVLRVHDGQLKARATDGPLREAHRQDIREHREALLELLQAPPSGPEVVEHMFSQVLGCEFWVMRTDAQAHTQRQLGRAAYSVREVRLLQQMKRRDPEGYDDKLWAIHLCHDLFDATMTQVERSPA